MYNFLKYIVHYYHRRYHCSSLFEHYAKNSEENETRYIILFLSDEKSGKCFSP